LGIYKSDRALELLRIGTRNSSSNFRGDQELAISEILEGSKRVLVVQRTGWGKSFVYFIATKLLREAGLGPVILVSPLLSLMRNQIEAAKRMGVVAVEMTSENSDQWSSITGSLLLNQIDILLISPERFGNPEFESNILPKISSNVSMLVIDEAHCISDWGHDFRPDYRRIESIVRLLPGNLRVLATTATANNRVLKDLENVLGSDLKSIRGNLERESLTLQSIRLSSPAERMAWIAETLQRLDGSGIIYALTIKDSELVTEWLKSRGLEVDCYTGDESTETKVSLEKKLIENRVKALVATTALGMGFDKPDLAFVIHYQTPPSVVAYYQQVGRAGRSIPSAYGILLSGREELTISNWFVDNAFPSKKEVSVLLETLERFPRGLNKSDFALYANMKKGRVEKILKLLSLERPSPIVKEIDKWKLTGIPLLNSFWERIERLTDLRKEEIAQMQEYVDLPFGKHMKFLVNALDCEYLSNSTNLQLPLSVEVKSDLVKSAEDFIDSRVYGIAPRKRWPSGNFTQLGRGKIPEELRGEAGFCLSAWGDQRMSARVQREKFEIGEFSDDLVNALANMVQKEYQSSQIEWVTFVPSSRRPILVSSLAKRLSSKLHLDYFDALTVNGSWPPQKDMQNSYYKVQNLDGKFSIKPGIPRGNVLLLDDMVESGWTLTVGAYLLKLAGSGLVFPCALARVMYSDS
jgi:ATP-dependent DNA helicase RecQ